MQIKNNLSVELKNLSNYLSGLAVKLQALETDTHTVNNGPERTKLAGLTVSGHIRENIKRLNEQIGKLDVKLDLVVAGRFRSGKSTFINALLKREVALVAETEMTYSLNFITHSPDGTDRARVYYGDGKVENFRINELNKKLLAERDNESFKQSIMKTEMFFPYPEIDEINIWDTPGLGSTTVQNRETTLTLIPESDVVLWVLDATALGDALDKKDVEDILRLNKPVIAIFNKMDSADIGGNTPESRSNILQYIDQSYGKIFKAVHFCSSKLAWEGVETADQEIYDQSGLTAINNYLQRTIFANKKEIIYGSAVASIREILTSIDSTLLTFSDHTNDRMSNLSTFISELKAKTDSITDKIFGEIKQYIDATVFEEEYYSSMSSVERLGQMGEAGFKQLIEKAVHKYTEDIWNMGRQRMRDLWQNSVYESEEVIQEETRAFAISQSFATSTDIVAYSGDTKAEQEQMAVILGGGTVALSIFSGSTFAASLFAGIGVGLLAFVVAGLNSTKDPNESHRARLKENLQLYKQNFYKDIFIGNIAPKLHALHSDFRQALVDRAAKHYLVMGDFAQNRSMIDLINDASGSINKMYGKLDESLSNLHAETRELFIKKIEHSDFIILAGNPNPGITKLTELLQSAQRYVYIVDPYFNLKSLSWIEQVNQGITVKVLLYHLDNEIEKHHTFITALKRIREGRKSPIQVRFIKFKHTGGTPLHDRFIFSGQWGLQMGNGLDVIGAKDISIGYIKDNKTHQENFFDNYWNMKSLKTEKQDKQVVTYDV